MFKSMFNKPAVPEADVTESHAVWVEKGAQFVDVRESDEWADAHMPESVHIPLGSLPQRFKELDPALPVIVICRSGGRSLNGAQFLLQSGFTDVRSMRGGLIDWARTGFPLER